MASTFREFRSSIRKPKPSPPDWTMTGHTLWYTRCPVPSPLGLAVQLGWLDEAFQADGIAVQSVLDSPQQSVRGSHFSHHLPWSVRQGGNIPALWARAQGAPTRLLGLSWTDEFQAIITTGNTHLGQAKELRGRRLALPRKPGDQIDFHGATALKGIWSALTTAGLDLNAVELVDCTNHEPSLLDTRQSDLFGLRRRQPYFQELAALVRGEVDAIFVKGAEGILIANLIGAQVVVQTGQHPDPIIRVNNGCPRPLTVDDALVQERPDLVTKLVSLVDRADQWAHAHPSDTLRFVAREMGCSEEAVLASNGPHLHTTLSLGLIQEQVDALAFFQHFLFEHGFIPNDLPVSDWVYRTT